MNPQTILKLAQDHGLALQEDMIVNNLGLDFLVAFATDPDGTRWVLRLPRRKDMERQIGQEKSILNLMRKHLPVAVPDWRIVAPDLIAYPLMEGQPVIRMSPETGDIAWSIDPACPDYVVSLAKVLAEIHRIPAQEAETMGLKSSTPEMVRREIMEKIELVGKEMGIPVALDTRWRKWVDDDRYWPGFSAVIHGDLYAGHILVDEKGMITGLIDWSEGQVGDPSVDFAGHSMLFGEASLRELILQYEIAGGKVWDGLFVHTLERQSAASLMYAAFALGIASNEHIEAARKMMASQ